MVSFHGSVCSGPENTLQASGCRWWLRAWIQAQPCALTLPCGFPLVPPPACTHTLPSRGAPHRRGQPAAPQHTSASRAVFVVEQGESAGPRHRP